jgi:RNA 2',3'-cyclic 3'-phosphodiesterase
VDSNRLFLALPINDHFERLITGFIDRQDIPLVKWINKENWHVTLVFIGNFPANHISRLIAELDHFFITQPHFSLAFDNFVYRPRQTKPSMIWVKFQQAKSFDQLCIRLFDHLEIFYFNLDIHFNIKLHPDNIPHTTLCRLKNPHLNYPDFNLNDISEMQPSLLCDKAYLMQSNLSSDGSKYSKLAEFNLS